MSNVKQHTGLQSVNEWVFGKAVTSGDLAKENKKNIMKQRCQLEMQIFQLRQMEEQALAAARAYTAANRTGAARSEAGRVRKLRAQISAADRMRANLTDLELRVESLRSADVMARAMRDVTEIMVSSNALISVPAMRSNMAAFNKQSAALAEKQTLMEEALAGTEAVEQVVDETEDEILGKLEAEVALSTSEQLSAAAPSREELWPESFGRRLCPEEELRASQVLDSLPSVPKHDVNK